MINVCCQRRKASSNEKVLCAGRSRFCLGTSVTFLLRVAPPRKRVVPGSGMTVRDALFSSRNLHATDET